MLFPHPPKRCKAKIPIKGIESMVMLSPTNHSASPRCKAKIPIKGIERHPLGLAATPASTRCKAKIPIKGIESGEPL